VKRSPTFTIAQSDGWQLDITAPKKEMLEKPDITSLRYQVQGRVTIGVLAVDISMWIVVQYDVENLQVLFSNVLRL
jgi:hypothetical protein